MCEAVIIKGHHQEKVMQGSEPRTIICSRTGPTYGSINAIERGISLKRAMEAPRLDVIFSKLKVKIIAFVGRKKSKQYIYFLICQYKLLYKTYETAVDKAGKTASRSSF